MSFTHVNKTDLHGAIGDHSMWWRIYGKPYNWMAGFYYCGFCLSAKPAVTDDFGNLVEVPA